eukprot:SAG25_NODE_92_length_16062_cov_54.931095_8_plen_985_part_00
MVVQVVQVACVWPALAGIMPTRVSSSMPTCSTPASLLLALGPLLPLLPAFAAAPRPPVPDAVQLVAPGGACVGHVVVPAQPRWIEADAAFEFTSHVMAATGCNLTVVPEDYHSIFTALVGAGGVPALFIGATSAAAKAFGAHHLDPEGFAVFVAPEDAAAFVVGDDKHSERCNASWTNGSITNNADCRRGTLYGVHALLRSLGFDWLWPGTSGTVLPPTLKSDGVRLAKELNLSDAPDLLVRRYRPSYERRSSLPWLVDQNTQQTLSRNERQWMIRMGFGSHGAPQWGEAFSSWWGKWGANGTSGHHPEWFALLQPHTADNPGNKPRRGPPHVSWSDKLRVQATKLCVSNRGLWHQVAAGYAPGTPGISACEDDGDEGYCTCDKCRAWDGTQTKMHWGVYSDRYARFWDKVAGLLAANFTPIAGQLEPPVVTGFSYSLYSEPPANYTFLNTNIMIGVVSFNAYPAPLNSLHTNTTGKLTTAAAQKRWDGWHKTWPKPAAAKMFWRPNIADLSPGSGPYQFSTAISANIQFMGARGLAATDIDSMENHWAQSGFSYWALAKAQWHPAAFDRDKQLAAFCSTGFGPAATAIHACESYINYWEEWTNRTFLSADVQALKGKGWPPHGSGSAVTKSVYTRVTLEAGAAILNQLTAACQHQGCEARAAFWRQGLTHANLTVAALAAVERYRQQPATSCDAQGTCDIGGPHSFLASALDLLAFRRAIAIHSPVNVHKLSAAEIKGDHVAGSSVLIPDQTGIAAANELLTHPGFEVPEFTLPPLWKFAFDPADRGLKDSPPWFSPQKNTSSWSTADVRAENGKCGFPTGNCGWAQTNASESWRKEHKGKYYDGVGWYQTRFALPARLNVSAGIGQRELVAVTWVCGVTASGWLNGQLMPPAKNKTRLANAGNVSLQTLHRHVELESLKCQEMAWRLMPLDNNYITFRIDSGPAVNDGGAAGGRQAPGLVSKVFVLSTTSNDLRDRDPNTDG